jgi:predicted nucleic acid-binding protein
LAGIGDRGALLEAALLDTSIWVRYLRSENWKPLKREVRRLLAEGWAHTCWVVKAELLIGARDEESFARLSGILRYLEEVPLTGEVWEEAARLGHLLRLKGLLIPLPDLLIAQAAISADLVLWHVDEHFERISQFSPLKTRSFLAAGR